MREPLTPHTGVVPHPLTSTVIAGIAHIIFRGPELRGNPFFKVPPIKVTSKGETPVGGPPCDTQDLRAREAGESAAHTKWLRERLFCVFTWRLEVNVVASV